MDLKRLKKRKKEKTLSTQQLQKRPDKLQHAFMIKSLERVGLEGIYLNIIKAIYDKSTVNIILDGKRKEKTLKQSY